MKGFLGLEMKDYIRLRLDEEEVGRAVSAMITMN